MNNIDISIAMGGMAGSIRARSTPEPHLVKLPVNDTPTQSNPHTQPKLTQTDVSFSTYGSRNEHLAVQVTNKETGEVIREIPSKEMQKLHVHLEVMV